LNFGSTYYQIIVRLLHKLRAYERREDLYISAFRRYVNLAETILDVGCGSGTFSKALAREDRLVVALDINKELLRQLSSGSIERICADAHLLPFRDETFDCILSLSLMEHLQRPADHIRELRRVLRKDGRLILQLPNLQYFFEPHTKWPLLWLLPKTVQSIIFKKLGYAYVNMNVTIKYALNQLIMEGFNLKSRQKLYHLKVMKLIPFPPSYIFILRKTANDYSDLH